MLKVRAKSVRLFPSAFVQGLSAALALEGHTQEQVSAVLDEYLGFAAFAPATNKAVLGCMNAIAQDLKHIIWHDGGLREADVGHIIHELNNTPWGATGYRYSSELVRDILGGARAQ